MYEQTLTQLELPTTLNKSDSLRADKVSAIFTSK